MGGRQRYEKINEKLVHVCTMYINKIIEYIYIKKVIDRQTDRQKNIGYIHSKLDI